MNISHFGVCIYMLGGCSSVVRPDGLFASYGPRLLFVQGGRREL